MIGAIKKTDKEIIREQSQIILNKTKQIAELEKENAELKEISDFQTSSNMDRYFQLKRSKEQLTKAKELLRYYFDCFKNDNKYTLSDFEVVEDTEQFLKDN